VDAKAAGKGKVTCKVSTPDGAELDVDVVENADGTFDIYYTAPEPGKYVITIRFGGEHIPNSPFHVVVSTSALWVVIFAYYNNNTKYFVFKYKKSFVFVYKICICILPFKSLGSVRFL